MTLNGWQRLWVVASILIGLSMIAETIKSFPDEDTARRNARYMVLAAYGPTDLSKQMDCMGHTASLSLSLDAPVFQRCDELSRGMTPVQSQQAHQRMEDVLPQMRDDLVSVKTQLVGAFALAWAAVCALLYFLGWSVAWVRRGFSK